MCASATDLNLQYLFIAFFTLLTLFAIDLELLLKLSWLVVRGKRLDRSPFPINGIINDSLRKGTNILDFLFVQLTAQSHGMDVTLMQSLIDIDVAQSTSHVLIKQELLDQSVMFLAHCCQIFRGKSILIINFRTTLCNRWMFEFFSNLGQIHRSELPDIIVDKTCPVSQQKLNVIMFARNEVLPFEEVLAFHSEMRNDGVVLKDDEQVFPISTNPCKPLADEFADELAGNRVLDD